MKPRIMFAGIDGSGKTTCMDRVIRRIDPRFRVLRVGVPGPALFVGGQKEALICGSWQERIDRARELSRRFYLYGVFLIFHFTYKFLYVRWLGSFRDSDLVFYETDTLLHPAAVITYHFPVARRLSARWRLRFMSILFGSRKKMLIFYLDVSPETAVRRIQQREVEEGVPIEPHENREDLAALKHQFEQLVAEAEALGYPIVRIEVEQQGLDEVREEVESALSAFLLT